MKAEGQVSTFSSWVRIARLQFYPMAFIAYSLGAAAAWVTAGIFSVWAFAIGYSSLFLVEFCTILANEYYDYETDRLNANFSTFSGGSRVLVEGGLSFRTVKRGIVVLLSLIPVSIYLLARLDGGVPCIPTILLILAGLFLGLAYTVPPLKLCYRGVGELVVATTHSFLLVLAGYVFQTGEWGHPLPWLLSVPLFFAVLAAIVLAGLPDGSADSAASKRTVVVLFGPRTAVVIASCSVGMAALSGFLVYYLEVGRWALAAAVALLVTHASVLGVLLSRLYKSGSYDRRIDGIMALALGYIVWFGVVPLSLLSLP